MGELKQYDTKDHPFELRHEVKRLNSRLDDIADALERSDFKDIIENYTNPKKRLFSNFTSGLARGLGLTIGTALVLALFGWITSFFVSMPLIGEFLANIQHYMDAYKK